MNTLPPIPVGVLVRVLKLPHALDAVAQWNSDGDILVTLPGQELTLRPLTREALCERFGAERMGQAVEGYLASDRRLILVQPGGGTIQWVEDPGVTDRLARVVADRVLEKIAVDAKAA